MIKIRFNLGRGKNFKKWKVTYSDKQVEYLDPKEYRILLFAGRLHNRPHAAERINKGANKYPCAWVECEAIHKLLVHELPLDKNTETKELMYNPRIEPFWRDEEGNNIDEYKFTVGVTKDYKVYELKRGASVK